MDIQSNNIAASLFDGLAQSQQNQGTAAKSDLFSKMMDRMLADAAARKREQAADAARDSASQAKEARDARAAEAQRKAAVRAEPKPDLSRDTRAQAARRNDADAEPARPQPPKTAGTDGDREVQARQDDRKPAGTDKAKESTRTEGAKAESAKADSTKSGGTKSGMAKSDAAKSGTEAAGAEQALAEDGTDALIADAGGEPADLETAMAEGGGSGDPSTRDAGTEEQTGEQPLPATAESALQQPTPQPSAIILAGLTAPGQTAAGETDDEGQGGDGAAAAGAAAAGTVDPAAQLAQAAAAGAAGAAAGADAAAKLAGGADAKPVDGDATRQAQAAALNGAGSGTESGEAAAEALPDDDSALPDRFADLLAAAKAKSGEAKQGGRQAGTDGGSRNDAQPQTMPQPAAAAQAAPQPAEAVAASAVKATGALDGIEGAAAAAGSAHGAAGMHTHPALAAMEGMHGGIAGGIPGIDQPQATATLRPSRGAAGMPMGVHDQIAVHIKKQVADEVDQFTINLHPAELGRIDIKLDIGADGRVSAMVAVERAQTLELLQRDSRGLERALQEAGLQTDSNSLNFSLRGEGNPFGNDGRGDGKGTGAGRRGRGTDGSGDDDSDAAVYTATLGNGRLDIRA